MPAPISIAVIVGSLRKDAYTRQMAHALGALNHQALALETVEIGDLPLYNQDLDNGAPPPPWVRFRAAMERAQGVLFITPEYNRSVPGGLKNAVDVGSRPYGRSIWAKKPGAIISLTPGALGAFGANHALRQSMVFLDMPMLQQPEAYLSHADTMFRDGGFADPKTAAFLTGFLDAFARWIERTRA